MTAPTGFHRLDGGAYLREQGYPERLVRLVAHHSLAIMRPEARGVGSGYRSIARGGDRRPPVAVPVPDPVRSAFHSWWSAESQYSLAMDLYQAVGRVSPSAVNRTATVKGIVVREAFEKELAGLQELLTELAVKAGAAMNTATHAMLDADRDAAQAVIAGDDDLDDLTGQIEHACYEAVARQQPVARDLRLVVSAMQISTSLERMGDLADHVAKQALMRHPRSSIPEDVRPMFAQMGAVADEMATRTAALLNTPGIADASRILAMDDQMDKVHRDLFAIVLSPTWTHGVQAAIDTTLMSRYYERYADHSVTVARRVIQLVTGQAYSDTGIGAHPATARSTEGSPGS